MLGCRPLSVHLAFLIKKFNGVKLFFLKQCLCVTVLMLNKKNFFSRNLHKNKTNIISHHSVIKQDSMFMTRGKQLNKEKQKN